MAQEFPQLKFAHIDDVREALDRAGLRHDVARLPHRRVLDVHLDASNSRVRLQIVASREDEDYVILHPAFARFASDLAFNETSINDFIRIVIGAIEMHSDVVDGRYRSNLEVE